MPMQARSPLQLSAWACLLVVSLGLLTASASPQAQPLTIQNQQAIETADGVLRSQGWQPDGDPALDSFDRELAGNGLSSLRSCSGTGAGFCRYDYRRGSEHLMVITMPNRDGDGLIHHWQLVGVEPIPPAGTP